jgi:WD40 repeat protein
MVLEGHDNWVRDVAFHPCGLFLISASDDRSVRIWDLSKARTLKTLSDAHRYSGALLLVWEVSFTLMVRIFRICENMEVVRGTILEEPL